MGIVGRYIDRLTDEQRDRIIVAQDWCSKHFMDGDNRCLVGHAINVRGVNDVRNLDVETYTDKLFRRGVVFAPGRFDHLCARFGIARIVRACKARAARNNAITLTAPLVRHG
jgi:hypothetical protein